MEQVTSFKFMETYIRSDLKWNMKTIAAAKKGHWGSNTWVFTESLLNLCWVSLNRESTDLLSILFGNWSEADRAGLQGWLSLNLHPRQGLTGHAPTTKTAELLVTKLTLILFPNCYPLEDIPRSWSAAQEDWRTALTLHLSYNSAPGLLSHCPPPLSFNSPWGFFYLS